MSKPSDYDEALEHWLRTEVVASIKEYEADPTNTIPIEGIMDWLRARHAERTEIANRLHRTKPNLDGQEI